METSDKKKQTKAALAKVADAAEACLCELRDEHSDKRVESLKYLMVGLYLEIKEYLNE